MTYGVAELNVIFGPNGLLLIGSDRAGPTPDYHVDIVRTCGRRAPEADEAWRLKTGYFPGLPIIMNDMTGRPAVRCAMANCVDMETSCAGNAFASARCRVIQRKRSSLRV